MTHNIEVCCMGQTTHLQLWLQDVVNREQGMSVSSASGTISSALKGLTVFKPDVIVIAVGESCPEIKSIIDSVHRATRSPVIVMGGNTQLKITAERAGIYDFILLTTDPYKQIRARADLARRIRLASVKNSTPIIRASAPAGGNKALFRTGFSGVLALGASCGGTEAIAEVIKALPYNIPGIAVVQHMPAGFTNMYAQRLDRESAVKVVEAKGLNKMETGKVLLAPGDLQMRVVRKGDGFYTETFNGQKVSGHKPSVDVLFNSVAKCAGRKAVGIILTGMGSDGAKGLLEMRRAGAFTIGQDERSSVVYGMPRVAYETGAVQRQVPLNNVAHTLISHLATIR